jgi:hypothetical protein
MCFVSPDVLVSRNKIQARSSPISFLAQLGGIVRHSRVQAGLWDWQKSLTVQDKTTRKLGCGKKLAATTRPNQSAEDPAEKALGILGGFPSRPTCAIIAGKCSQILCCPESLHCNKIFFSFLNAAGCDWNSSAAGKNYLAASRVL